MSFEKVTDWKSDLLRERTLLQVYDACKDVVGNESDKAVFRTFLGGSLIFVLIGRIAFNDFGSGSISAKLAVEWSHVAVGFASSILGFLIAGFAILSTNVSKETLIKLAQVKRSDREISQLKFLYFNFLYVFIHYILFIALAGSVIFFSHQII